MIIKQKNYIILFWKLIAVSVSALTQISFELCLFEEIYFFILLLGSEKFRKNMAKYLLNIVHNQFFSDSKLLMDFLVENR
jgi:hypothetical protein